MHHSRFPGSSRLLALPVLAALAHGQVATDVPYYATGVSASNCSGTLGYGPMQSLDVYLPAGGFSHSMTILYLHPGGWSGGDKTEAHLSLRK